MPARRGGGPLDMCCFRDYRPRVDGEGFRDPFSQTALPLSGGAPRGFNSRRASPRAPDCGDFLFENGDHACDAVLSRSARPSITSSLPHRSPRMSVSRRMPPSSIKQKSGPTATRMPVGARIVLAQSIPLILSPKYLTFM